MKHYNPPHPPTDKAKTLAMVEAIRQGQSLPPIVINGDNALTGSHRIAAYEIAWKLWDSQAPGWDDASEPTIEVIECSNEDLDSVASNYDLATGDFNALASALYATTNDFGLKAALADQCD